MEVDVSEEWRKLPDGRSVQLLFVRDVNEPGSRKARKENWALYRTIRVDRHQSRSITDSTYHSVWY